MNTHPTAATGRTVRSRAWRLAAIGTAGAALIVTAGCGDDDDDATDTTGAAATSGAPATTGAAATTAAPATTMAPATTAAPATTGAAATTAAPDTSGAPGAGAPTLATAETDLGTVLVNAEGLTLYAFTPDADGVPTCTGECAGAWPPALVEGEPNYGDLDASVFSLVENPEGGQQLKAGDWPLYTFQGDSAPGDTTGQGQGDVWYVVAPDGTLIQ